MMENTVKWSILLLRLNQIALVIAFFALWFLVFFSGNDTTLKMKSNLIGTNVSFQTLEPTGKIVMISIFLLFILLLFYAIQQIIRSLNEFKANRFFTDKVIHSFKFSGYTFFALFTLHLMANPILSLFSNKFELTIGVSILDQGMAFLLISLLLLVLSTVFQRAKELQEENQLTI